jgi:hypothetical protein
MKKIGVFEKLFRLFFETLEVALSWFYGNVKANDVLHVP